MGRLSCGELAAAAASITTAAVLVRVNVAVVHGDSYKATGMA
jgi:hypothetical protein